MDPELGIIWYQLTDQASDMNLWETGWRANPLPRTEEHPQDAEFKQIRDDFFREGPKLKFVRSDTFVGSLPGYEIYLRGELGLGYYIDPLIMRQVIHQ